MITLKEGLLNKKNINKLTNGIDSYWYVYVPSDINLEEAYEDLEDHRAQTTDNYYTFLCNKDLVKSIIKNYKINLKDPNGLDSFWISKDNEKDKNKIRDYIYNHDFENEEWTNYFLKIDPRNI